MMMEEESRINVEDPIIEGDVTPVIGNLEESAGYNLNDDNDRLVRNHVRALPADLQANVAMRLCDIHAADGGLSEESVVGSNQTPTLIRDLAAINNPPPARHVPVPASSQNRSLASCLTDPTYLPTDIERFRNDDSTAFTPVPNSVNISEPMSNISEPMSTFDDDAGTSEQPSSTDPERYADATEPAEDTSPAEGSTSPERQQTNSGLSLQFGLGQKCCLVVFVPAIILLLVLAVAIKRSGSHHHGTTPPKPPPGNRTEQVFSCASKLSGHEITQQQDPLRWKVTQYFIDGPGNHIDPTDCYKSGENSFFSILYSIIVLRESLQVKIPTWNDFDYNNQKITGMTDVCSWKRVKCDPVMTIDKRTEEITKLYLNTGDLSGTLPPEIQWIRSLQWLQICSNWNVTGPMPSEIGLLSNLEELQIQSTAMKGTIPTDVGRMTSLERFFLYSTQLSGTMPSQICNLPNLSTLSADCRGPTPSVACSCCTKCQEEEEEEEENSDRDWDDGFYSQQTTSN